MSEVKCSTCKGAKTIAFERGQRCVPCVTCSGSGIDWRKTCAAAQSELAALREELASVCSMACMIEDREWAEHAGKGPVAEKLESAITDMHNELSDVQQRLTAAEQRNAELIAKLAERDDLLAETSKAILRHQAEQPMSHRLAGLLTKARAKVDRYLKAAALKPAESGASDEQAAN